MHPVRPTGSVQCPTRTPGTSVITSSSPAPSSWPLRGVAAVRRGTPGPGRQLRANTRRSWFTSAGRSSIAMCPAFSTTTSFASGSAADQLHRGGRRRDAVVLADDHERRHADSRKRVAEVHLHQLGEAVGPHLGPRAPGEPDDVVHEMRRRVRAELGHSGHDTSNVGGARQDGAAEAVDPARSGRERAHARAQRARSTDPIAPRNRSDDDAPISTTPATRGPKSSGRCSAIARIAIAPMLCPTTTAGRLGRDRVEHRGDVAPHRTDRQVARAAARPLSPVRAMVHQHASEVVGQVDPLLVPGGHVQAEPVGEQQDRAPRASPGARTAISVPSKETHRTAVVRRQIAEATPASLARWCLA